jgi:hypothetical protein
MLRGFFIFLVLICKPSIWEKIKIRHPAVARCLAVFLTCFCCPKANNNVQENGELLPMHDTVNLPGNNSVRNSSSRIAVAEV